MKQSSRKKKGKLLQNLVRDKILKTFRHLKKKDVDVAQTGEPGIDIKLSKTARRLVRHSFETKNQERMATIYQWYDQADKNAKDEPVLVIKQNGRRPLVVVDLDHFFNQISG